MERPRRACRRPYASHDGAPILRNTSRNKAQHSRVLSGTQRYLLRTSQTADLHVRSALKGEGRGFESSAPTDVSAAHAGGRGERERRRYAVFVVNLDGTGAASDQPLGRELDPDV